MDGHLDVALLAGGHDGLEEVDEVLAQLGIVHVLVDLEEALDLGEAIGLPSGQHEAVGVLGVRVEQDVGVVGDVLLDEGERLGAVGQGVVEAALHPVEHGHEVVADDLHAKLCEVADGLLVVLDVAVAAGQADLDVVVDVDRLDDLHREAVRVRLVHERLDAVCGPDLPHRNVHDAAHDALDARDLADLVERHLVLPGTVPAKRHFHVRFLSVEAVSEGVTHTSRSWHARCRGRRALRRACAWPSRRGPGRRGSR